MYRKPTNTFGMSHTLMMGKSNQEYRPNNYEKICLKYFLKNIWKLSKNCHLAAPVNTFFRFTHVSKSDGGYVDVNFLFIVLSIHHSRELMVAR